MTELATDEGAVAAWLGARSLWPSGAAVGAERHTERLAGGGHGTAHPDVGTRRVLGADLVTLSPAEVSQDFTEATSAADGANSARTAEALMKCR